MEMRKIARALLSVSDKTGLIDFAQRPERQGVELVSTGGTAKLLREAGLKVIDVAEITRVPEMMGGRVKTLHPKIHGGLLAVRGKKEHEQALKDHEIPPFDLVVVNLYPFETHGPDRRAISRPASRTIDIGGPALIRAGAKNHCLRHRRGRARGLSACARRDGDEWRRDDACLAQVARGQGLRPHRRNMMRRSPPGSPRPTATRAGITRPCRHAGASAPLWREPASMGRLLPHGRAPLRRRDRRAGAGQGALLQQSERRRCGLRACGRVRSRQGGRSRHHQARQSVRRGARRHAQRGLRQGARLRPDQRLRRHRRAQPHLDEECAREIVKICSPR